MKFFNRFKIKPGVLIFIVYLGLAIFEYLRTKHWTGGIFFGVLALVFLLVDAGKEKENVQKQFTH